MEAPCRSNLGFKDIVFEGLEAPFMQTSYVAFVGVSLEDMWFEEVHVLRHQFSSCLTSIISKEANVAALVLHVTSRKLV